MSYILDALRKADAERERDPARGIHAQPLAGLPGADRASRSFAWIGGATVGLAAAGLAAAGVLVYLSQAAPAAPSAQDVPAAPAPVGAATPMPMPLAADGPAAVPAVAPTPPAPPAVVANAVLPAAPPPAPPARPVPVARVAPPAAALRAAPIAAAAPQGAAAPGPAPQAAALAPARSQAAAPAVLKAPAAEVATRILAMKDLPPDVQRELPKLAITGGVHSDNAAQRMLIVGGQVFSEGATLAPGVVLEQISARAAVLQFRGHRFSVPY